MGVDETLNFHVVPKTHKALEPIEDTVRRLYPNHASTNAKLFRQYNEPLATNGMFSPGQPLFLPGTPGMCTANEPAIESTIQELKRMHGALRKDEQQTLAERFAIISFLEEHGTAGVGAGSAAFANRVKLVESILLEIEDVYVKTYERHGHLHQDEFLRTRRRLFRRLDQALGSLVRTFGFEARRAGKMKAQLGINTKSQILTWQRGGNVDARLKSFPPHYERMSKLAQKIKIGGYALIALDLGIAGKKIHDACSLPDVGDYHCQRTSYKQMGKFAGAAVLGGVAGGAAYTACNLVLGAPTLGTSLLWCAVVVGGVASFGGGHVGGYIGESAGEAIFENVYPME